MTGNTFLPQTTSSHKINIALVSDFFKPYTGGVELHINKLATLLPQRTQIGKVIVITHKYQKFGKQYIGVMNANGFKIYYLNLFYNRTNMVIMPSFIYYFQQAKNILQSQNIHIVHCHQSSSTLSLQYIAYCKVLNIRVILTQHSLIGFRDLKHIIYNKFSQIFLRKCYRIIAVSQTAKNNIILRTHIHPNIISVIPNGVQNLGFVKKVRKDSQIRIIIVGRIAHRRGADILIQALPQICALDPNIKIWIVGDGDKVPPLKAQIEIRKLEKQVLLLGVKPHNQLLQLLTQADIFLNPPLTQSFGIALAEAAQIGLFCISTNVGAIRQSIPRQLLHLVGVSSKSLIKGVEKRIKEIRDGDISLKNNLQNFSYSWDKVVDRTIEVYQNTVKEPKKKILSLQDVRFTAKDINFMLLYVLLLIVVYAKKLFNTAN